MGGELLLQTAADSTAIEAVVSEGAGLRSPREAQELSGFGLTKLRYLWGSTVQTAATALFGSDLPPANLAELVPRIAPRPVLLIQAGRGAGGEELNAEYHEAAGLPKELWAIPEASHTGGITARPDEYERRVVGFFDRALLEEAPRG